MASDEPFSFCSTDRLSVASDAPDVMLIFRDVGQVREVAERPDDRDSLGRIECAQYRFELRLGVRVLVPVKADRGLADRLDNIEDVSAFLGLDDVAQQPAEKTDVVFERQVL